MKIRFEKMGEGDREAVIDLFNYYIENSFAAYPDKKVPYGLFDQFLALTEGYPAFTVRDEESADRIVGFAFLRPYHPLRDFSGRRKSLISSNRDTRAEDRFENPRANHGSANARGSTRSSPTCPRSTSRACVSTSGTGLRSAGDSGGSRRRRGRISTSSGCRDPLKTGRV